MTGTIDFADTLFEVLKSAMPYLLMGGKVSPLVGIVLVPILMYMATRLRNHFAERKLHKRHTVVLKNERNEYTRCNVSVIRLTWYIRNVIKLQGCTYSSGTSQSLFRNDTDATGYNLPEMTLHSTKGELDFDYHGKKVWVECHTEQIEKTSVATVFVSAENEETIEKLLDESSHLYADYYEEKVREARLHKRTVNTPDFGQWISAPLRIHKTFNNTFLPRDVHDLLIADIDEFKTAEKAYRERGIPYKRGYLLYGPPGTGKTSTYYAIAEKMRSCIYKLHLSQVQDDNTLRVLVRDIEPGSVIVVDDVDRIKTGTGRTAKKPKNSFEDSSSENMGGGVSLQALLEVFDGYDYLHGCIVVFTANDISAMDPALIRPGRIDFKIHLDYPKSGVVRDIFTMFYGVDGGELLDNATLDANAHVPTADIINNIVMPNRGSIDRAASLLRERLETAPIPEPEPKAEMDFVDDDVDIEDAATETQSDSGFEIPRQKRHSNKSRYVPHNMTRFLQRASFTGIRRPTVLF